MDIVIRSADQHVENWQQATFKQMIGEGQAVENARFGCRIHYLNRGDDKSVIFCMDFQHLSNSVGPI